MLNLLVPMKYESPADYWRARARRHGRKSVLNLAHGESHFEAVTESQKQILFPLLKAELQGWETEVLDFGCGPGRFTDELAELVKGKAVGADITPELLELAPESSRVEYRCIESSVLPFADASFDVVWSCLVLGGIPEKQIKQSLAEIERVLRPGGLFFFVENTASTPDTNYWFFRGEDTYIRLAAFCSPKIVGRYDDLGQPVTIFSGRKCADNKAGATGE